MQHERVAVFGGGGQLGAELVKAFGARGYETMGFERAAVDVADPEAVEQCIAQNHPSWVVNAAAYNKVDAAEREPQIAFLANALAVRNLAVACRETNARLVHFSTDYIFDGLAGRSYTEDDEPHPLGAYAVSKLAGELYARAYLEEPLIIRTCGVYGPHGAATAQGNFVETMLRRAAQGQPVRVVDDYIASPTFAPALATRTVEMVERGLHGIFHAGGGTPISWYDWAAKIFQVAGLTPDLRRTNEQEFRTAARRPKYSALSNARMESLGVTPMPSLDEAIRAYFEARGTYASQVAR